MENMTLMREALWHDADEFLDIKTQQWNQPESIGKAQGCNPEKDIRITKDEGKNC
jgi:hypothetical protein